MGQQFQQGPRKCLEWHSSCRINEINLIITPDYCHERVSRPPLRKGEAGGDQQTP